MIRYAYCIAAVLFVALVGSKFDRQTSFTSLIRFGETWQNRRLHSLENLPIATVEKSSGYDGQFYAQIALDPLLRDTELNRAIDAPAYRARRILTPAVAAVLGAGNAWWTLQVYALLNVISWFALAWLLRTWIAGNDWTGFARWGACMFSLGVLDSVRQSLVDLPALLLLSLAIRASTRVQPSKSILWLALGNLAKETTLIGTVALCIIGYSNGSRWRRTFLLSLIPALPLLAWWLYVDHRFSAIPSTEGLGNFTWPLLGLFVQVKSCLHELLLGNFDSRFSFGLLAVIGLTAQTSVLWRNRDFNSPWWRVGAAYSLLLPFLSVWVWSGYWAVCRALLPLTIAFNLLLPLNRRFWPLWTIGNLTLLHAVWRFL